MAVQVVVLAAGPGEAADISVYQVVEVDDDLVRANSFVLDQQGVRS